MNYDYAIHSDFLIHWTGKDIDRDCNEELWYEKGASKTCDCCTEKYIKRLENILDFGLWMTEEQQNEKLTFEKDKSPQKIVEIPKVAKTCFTELKLSESRDHAKRYGRLGIGFKRFFLFSRFGRPVTYYVNDGVKKYNLDNDKFLRSCIEKFENSGEKHFLNFFKSMNSKQDELNYDLYRESEWRIIYFKELETNGIIIDPSKAENNTEYQYYQNLKKKEQKLLKYLIPLDGWLSMIIYPSLQVKNKVQETIRDKIRKAKSKIIKQGKLEVVKKGEQHEKGNWPLEIDLDACRNF